MHLPLDYPRINQFPEWFTAQEGKRYEVAIGEGASATRDGEELIAGLRLELAPGRESRLRVTEK